MYSTYEQYQQRGGKLSETEYDALACRASEIIDYYTAGQASEVNDMTDALCACECELVGFLQSASVSGIQSENNDGYSVTYASEAEQKRGMVEILKQYLTFPHNLISVSGWAYI